MANRGHFTTYDEAPYRSMPNPLGHPSNMATVARLLGLSPPELSRCRVLEIGSGTGTNLIPIAEELSGGEHIGIDLSAKQVELCNEEVAALGLKNVRFQQMDLLDVSAELGKFDYVIAHGMYSWVPPAARDKLVAICQDNLTDRGIAFISYNVLPGWHVRQMLRDIMSYHVRTLDDPAARAEHAQQVLDFLCEGITGGEGSMPLILKTYAEHFRDRLRRLGPTADSLLHHDMLAGVNQPVYFHAFVEHATQHGLAYLAEAAFELSRMSTLPQGPRQLLEQTVDSLVEMEQYMDFLDMRMFRQTLLCKKEQPIDRTLSAERLRGLYVRAEVRSVSARPDLSGSSVERFMGPEGATISTNHPLSKAALQILSDIHPRSMEFCALVAAARLQLGEMPSQETQDEDAAAASRDAQEMGQLLLSSFCKRRDIVSLRAHETHVVERISDKPQARKLARHQARQMPMVTNAYHLNVELEPLPHALLQLLDGTRDRDGLIEGLLDLVRSGSLKVRSNEGEPKPIEQLRGTFDRVLDQILKSLAQRALLIN
jgi:methyltransferase-like protein/2-polyprenyl-3-methyl-5-hydroxy-6-metoxy-1,4-benzoquinol methylase